MTYRIFSLCFIAALLSSPVFAQKAVYVASDGSILGSGSLTAPVRTIEAALTRVVPGDTIYVRGGTYASPSSVRINNSGAEGAISTSGPFPARYPSSTSPARPVASTSGGITCI